MPRIPAALTLALIAACASHGAGPRPPVFPSRAAWKTMLGEFVVPPLAADSRRLYVATRDAAVRALAAASGEVAWKAESLSGRVSAAEGVLLVRAEDGVLTSLQPRTGRPRWTAATTVTGTLPAVIDEDRAYVAGRGFAAVELATGRVLFTLADADITAPPLRAGARLLTGEADGVLRCRDRATGATLWTLRTGRPLLAAPLADTARRRLYLGTTDRRILEVDLDDGSQGWSWRVGADVADTGVLLPERVIFAPLDAALYSLHRGGKLAWRGGLPSRPLAGPLLAGGALIVACLDNELVAFDAATGAPLGSMRTSAVIRTALQPLGSLVAVGLSDRSVVAFPVASPAGGPPEPAPAVEPPAPGR